MKDIDEIRDEWENEFNETKRNNDRTFIIVGVCMLVLFLLFSSLACLWFYKFRKRALRDMQNGSYSTSVHYNSSVQAPPVISGSGNPPWQTHIPPGPSPNAPPAPINHFQPAPGHDRMDYPQPAPGQNRMDYPQPAPGHDKMDHPDFEQFGEPPPPYSSFKH